VVDDRLQVRDQRLVVERLLGHDEVDRLTDRGRRQPRSDGAVGELVEQQGIEVEHAFAESPCALG
jgi:hypothetical protein